MEDEFQGGEECRVCRMAAEEKRLLYKPCLCSGSIGLVHQDCLEAWLEHSKKETCELCFSRYQFTPEYAENAPTTVPLFLLLKSACKIIAFSYIPTIMRIALAIFLWLFVSPVWTSWIYRFSVRSQDYVNIPNRLKWSLLKLDVISGIILIGIIILSFIILVSGLFAFF